MLLPFSLLVKHLNKAKLMPRDMQVHARVVVIETDRLWNGIADIVSQYSIRKLVMGSSTEK